MRAGDLGLGVRSLQARYRSPKLIDEMIWRNDTKVFTFKKFFKAFISSIYLATILIYPLMQVIW